MIKIEKAAMADAKKLTELMKKTFDEEARRWLTKQDGVDYNIQPPGYSSIEMTKYMIEELMYYKIIYNQDIVGGAVVTITGQSFGRIDRIYVDPDYQGKKIGTQVMGLIEAEFPDVRTWDLETSARQLNNHHFYEKLGYKTTFKTDDEYCYIKQKETTGTKAKVVENQDHSHTQYESCNLAHTEYYQINLADSSFSNSNLMNAHFNNCNLEQSKFHNINFKHSVYADLNLSYSKMRLVTLAGVKFVDTNLGDDKEPISFERCDLQGTRIRNCDLRNLEIKESDIAGMKIDGIPVEDLLEVYKQEMRK